MECVDFPAYTTTVTHIRVWDTKLMKGLLYILLDSITGPAEPEGEEPLVPKDFLKINT